MISLCPSISKLTVVIEMLMRTFLNTSSTSLYSIRSSRFIFMHFSFLLSIFLMGWSKSHDWQFYRKPEKKADSLRDSPGRDLILVFIFLFQVISMFSWINHSWMLSLTNYVKQKLWDLFGDDSIILLDFLGLRVPYEQMYTQCPIQ